MASSCYIKLSLYLTYLYTYFLNFGNISKTELKSLCDKTAKIQFEEALTDAFLICALA